MTLRRRRTRWRKRKEGQNSSCWGAISCAVGPVCSKNRTAIYHEILVHLMIPPDDKLHEYTDLIFQSNLAHNVRL